ncbi:MAG: glycoside hydrolase family 15 protein [Bacillota bacterium]
MPRKAYYAIVGNGETVALIHPQGSVAWLCIPRFDSFPVFAGALDPRRGGGLRLHFSETLTPHGQRYRGRTNVLETQLVGSGITVHITDFMPWRQRCLVRLIAVKNTTGEGRTLSLRVEPEPVQTAAHRFHAVPHSCGRRVSGSAGHLLVGGPAFDSGSLEARCRLEPEEERTLRLVVAYGTSVAEAEESLAVGLAVSAEECALFWQNWLRRAYPVDLGAPDLEEAYYRSLLVLKLLTYEKNGAIIAAPTSSFPATPGGSDNWDYRYCWLRDGYFTALAFDKAGFHHEAHRFYDFAYSLQGENGNWRQPLYTLDGRYPCEMVVTDLAGPGGERPVRMGNLAGAQLQLDNEGSMLHGLWVHYMYTGDREYLARRWDAVRRAATWLSNNWFRPEHGIWEFRERVSQWTYGKAVTYGGLMAAVRIGLELGQPHLAEIWRATAQQVLLQVLGESWSERRQAFVRHYGEDGALDVSTLALAFYGLVDPSDERMRRTVALLDRTPGCLVRGGIARWECAPLPFYLATFWLARYYFMVGNNERGWALLKTCLDNTTTLGLMAEHFDPETGEQWGNFPQAFSHEELLQTVWVLKEKEYSGGFESGNFRPRRYADAG